MTDNRSPRLTLVAAVFEDENQARRAVERLIENDFPMDRISLLHHARGSGDDMLGISFHDSGERIRTWGGQGAFWGALWGLLGAASGLFLLPGAGALMAAGPIIEMLGSALIGAAAGGTVMAGAAVVEELVSALHAAGIPEEHLQELHDDIMSGHPLVLLHCPPDDEDCRHALDDSGARKLREIPVWY